MFKDRSQGVALVVLLAGALMVVCSCATTEKLLGKGGAKGGMDIDVTAFGETGDGEAVRLYRLSNGKGMTAEVMTYGAIVTSLTVPDKDGKAGDDRRQSEPSGDPCFDDPLAPRRRHTHRLATA